MAICFATQAGLRSAISRTQVPIDGVLVTEAAVASAIALSSIGVWKARWSPAQIVSAPIRSRWTTAAAMSAVPRPGGSEVRSIAPVRGPVRGSSRVRRLPGRGCSPPVQHWVDSNI
ncbi:MAG: hypothetical protein BGP03_26845 [Pseudonocardia sp. 73-21]|nr:MULTISPECIES: hypothetical protein [unclassified Pseudonocardia]OJY46334.1 MAG: hypothetical protein BGP03_26845 [Pseudonocardia sp. 73-21]